METDRDRKKGEREGKKGEKRREAEVEKGRRGEKGKEVGGRWKGGRDLEF